MNQELINYIRENLAKGIPHEQIRQTLLNNGWQTEDIEAAFSQLQVPQTILPPISDNTQSTFGSKLKLKEHGVFLTPKILITFLIIFGLTAIGGSYFYFFREKPETSKVNAENNLPITDSFLNESPHAEIFREGFYVNRDLQFSFEYPADWILGEKVIDRKGNLNNLAFYLVAPTVSELSQLESFLVSVTREGGENYLDFIVNSKSNLNREKRRLGDLNGDFYSGITDKRYDASFVATPNGVKYGFHLSVPSGKKEVYLAKFEELISTVKVNDTRASSLPKYFRDNLALDKRVSEPSHIPNKFSITYEKQDSAHQEWNYSIGVWEHGSGPNNLNIDVQRVGTKNDLGPRQFTVNLENLLEEKSIHQPVVEKGVAKVEPIEVKGFKGYFINIGKSLDNSYGSLIFATDIVAVSIDYISELGSVFSKEELLKIAESMIH
ncbi:MAG: hypothetical protein UU67_C0016G0010 [Candidatus Daviesbacteria bacterium GW2011_GWB1_41_5]|uniref:Uncharacterized protein n=1 Tax=Candidatus Daviesbacteria bacterium GW2011_GWB1_41_5 TaxID=1618429 RepID=A0A0G0WP04_9BACT|nr:MAG: hypothetical protein UU67_C0016G0010 [Candidatus Daviesbacteria bacterium GW2011_GWB1_41_5]